MGYVVTVGKVSENDLKVSESESTVALDVRFVGYEVAQNGVHVLSVAEDALAVATEDVPLHGFKLFI